MYCPLDIKICITTKIRAAQIKKKVKIFLYGIEYYLQMYLMLSELIAAICVNARLVQDCVGVASMAIYFNLTDKANKLCIPRQNS